ncbi:MAG: DNA replication and repair protein RecF [Chlamydiales bacterium]|nr:DNA replication and repair protein RecF [Chlamydiales bacterium]MCH9620188.1 DNA replication and repair protein RecF [Chlamydiales bacterium]MCH9623097.1 DNA replication and repair protein RecF [Chlamydiales bacterium]
MMRLERLYLRHFRNFEEATLLFSPEINLIYGENAQGKTSILEAIYLLITGRSFRARHLSDLIQFGKDAFVIEATFEKNGVSQQLSMQYNGKERRICLGVTPLPKLSSLLGILQGVLLTPEDDALAKGLPKVRRHFLDLHIAQFDPLYIHHLSRYTKAMRHRNVLLREQKTALLSPFEETMEEAASYLSKKRLSVLKELEQKIDHDPEKISLQYAPSLFSTEQREKELILGTTLSGPHKDDFIPYLDEREVKNFASEGQKRSCVAALKLAQFHHLCSNVGELPLLLIDDFGISFDQKRERSLFEKIESQGQVFLTTCQPKEMKAHPLLVVAGKIETPELQVS